VFDVVRVFDELNEGPLARPFVRSSGSVDESAVLDVDLDALTGRLVESLPNEDAPFDVVDGEVDALTGQKAEVCEQSVGDLLTLFARPHAIDRVQLRRRMNHRYQFPLARDALVVR
jgi:hypothetical protein